MAVRAVKKNEPIQDVHPVAALFPMLAGEEFGDLVADIKANGLLQSIVLDQEGRILDGRNRLAACKVADVQPHYTTYDGTDAASYALSVNIARRHLTKGQRAMIAAKACPETGQTIREMADATFLSKTRISLAAVVIQHAPELVDAVIAGGSLDQAYGLAQKRKVERETRQQQESRDLVYLSRFPEYAEKVGAGLLTIAQALAAVAAIRSTKEREAREREEREAQESVEARQLTMDEIAEDSLKEQIQRLIDQIDHQVVLRPEPDLTPPRNMEAELVPGSARADESRKRYLEFQREMLSRLINVREELARVHKMCEDNTGETPDFFVAALRAGVKEIANGAYAIAESFDIDRPNLRMVK